MKREVYIVCYSMQIGNVVRSSFMTSTVVTDGSIEDYTGLADDWLESIADDQNILVKNIILSSVCKIYSEDCDAK